MTTESGVVATKAIIIHEAKVELISFDNTRRANARSVLTVHDIFESNQGPVIGAGQAMSDTDREMLRSLLNGESPGQSRWWPETLLFQDAYQMVWYVPPAKRSMYFRVGNEQKKFNLWWPGLVMSYKIGKGFRVIAYAGSGRPSHDQKLYHAPLWNINAVGGICSGSAITSREISPEAMDIWNRVVFDTNFTHSNHEQIIAFDDVQPKAQDKELNQRYLDFIRYKAEAGTRIQAAEMVETGRTLKEWAESL